MQLHYQGSCQDLAPDHQGFMAAARPCHHASHRARHAWACMSTACLGLRVQGLGLCAVCPSVSLPAVCLLSQGGVVLCNRVAASLAHKAIVSPVLLPPV